jgi:tryptophan synthase alpha chain
MARREPDVPWVAAEIARLRGATALPLAVGFGMRRRRGSPLGAVADGLIVGSALVDSYAGTRGTEAARRAEAFGRRLRTALRRGRE